MDVPLVPHIFDRKDIKASVDRLLPFLFPHRSRDCEEIEVDLLTQGTTNWLYKVTRQGPRATPVDSQVFTETALVKVYGDGTDITIDRKKELAFHKVLSDHDLAPLLLVHFPNGHGYEFTKGKVCSLEDITQETVWRGVSKELARWHAILPVADLDYDGGSQTVLNHAPNVWSTAKKWLESIAKGTEYENSQKQLLNNDFDYLVNRLLSKRGSQHHQVFGHGDLLCGNIILLDSAEEGTTDRNVKFIDYEHSTYCPRAFELANHFAEWAGFDCDYSLLPTRSTRREFIREYLRTYEETANRCKKVDASSQADQIRSIDDELSNLMDEVDNYRGFPGFYWGLCALIQAQATTGSIDFDYAGYAMKRFAEFRAWREEDDGSRHEANRDITLREKRWASD
ncbi:kinase-like domain-containing protein [Daldinia vernicosa]|uniref:kinase-like domain-containing protein n=1 Tax=Daldinia vernicosa TaxID=114800 RepID=UPI002007446A|nr:kinase-like domain-containing protein [Daldinia vernicosa]KAI0848439.1 kinase-like domain-containing protein [Daldinia vernicosa]